MYCNVSPFHLSSSSAGSSCQSWQHRKIIGLPSVLYNMGSFWIREWDVAFIIYFRSRNSPIPWDSHLALNKGNLHSHLVQRDSPVLVERPNRSKRLSLGDSWSLGTFPTPPWAVTQKGFVVPYWRDVSAWPWWSPYSCCPHLGANNIIKKETNNAHVQNYHV